jgi:transposase
VGRRRFTPGFKLEVVKLVKERAVSVRQAAADLGLHENLLRKWVRNVEAHREQAFPGQGRMRPDDAAVARLRRASEESDDPSDLTNCCPPPTTARCDVRSRPGAVIGAFPGRSMAGPILCAASSES